MPVSISDLWVPQLWIQGINERQATFPALFNSKAIMRSPLMDEFASGPGTSINIPFFKDITDQADEVQVENTAPVTDNGQPSGLQVATPCNRAVENSVGALAIQVSGSDPVGSILSQLAERRLKQRQAMLISILRALFGTGATAANAAAPLSATRFGGTTAEIFIETTAGQTSANLISPTLFIQAKWLMGELANTLANGCFFCHPNIQSALEVLDALNFKTTIAPSALPFAITTYRGIPIYTSNSLVRAGTTSGFVYDSYLLAEGVVAYGEKPQVGDTVDVAALSFFQDKAKNTELIYDRTRSVILLNGTKWVGTPGAQSATNAELQTIANWNLVYQTANRCGAVAFRTNG